MPTKAELYAQMADKVATQLTGSWQEWAGFLTTASRLYKYPFHEQLMIYAQRQDATACAEYDLWNEKMGRYVRRGSKGIALVDDSGDRPRLRYVFDISDTGTREHSRTPWLWQLEERHLDSVQAMLERTYDVSGDDLGTAPYITAHLFIPQIVLRTGGGVRSLGIDHQLLMERVLVKAGSSSEKPCPFLPAPRELCCHLVRHLRI